MARISGTLTQIGEENISQILLVAGGGGGAESDGGSHFAGGDGGGETAGNGGNSGGIGATPTSGYAFGQGGVNWNGGGGGLYGGYGGEYNTAGGGGSGYIGGVPEFIYNGAVYSPSNITGGGTGRQAHGKAQITFIEETTEEIVINPHQVMYTGGIQTYTASKAGIYKLEVWGAGGADSNYGGIGGYSSGYCELAEGETIYIVVGGYGTISSGGYNGGGSSNVGSTGGGGATHMARISGTLTEIGEENISQILLVAGGGGGAETDGDSHFAGGDGGGETAGNGGNNGGMGATSTSGYAFGQGGVNWNGGGGGLYGGYGGEYNSAGGGGSGYIGGVPEFEYNGVVYSPSTITGGGTGRQANGKAQITFVM